MSRSRKLLSKRRQVSAEQQRADAVEATLSGVVYRYVKQRFRDRNSPYDSARGRMGHYRYGYVASCGCHSITGDSPRSVPQVGARVECQRCDRVRPGAPGPRIPIISTPYGRRRAWFD